jgi:hypothetical protein
MPPAAPRYTSSGTSRPIRGTSETLGSYRTAISNAEEEEDPGYLADDEDESARMIREDIEYLESRTWIGGFGELFWKMICHAVDEKTFRW